MVKRMAVGYVILLIATAFYSSCLLPIYVPPSGQGVIDVSDIKPGLTTKEDFFLEYGNAFTAVDNGNRNFTAAYSKLGSYTVLIIVPYGPVWMTKEILNKGYEVEVQFDDNDIVKDCEVFDLPRRNMPKLK